MSFLLALYIIAFAIAFFLVLQAADFAIVFATRLARDFNVSEFAISFLLVGLITALPESIIAFTASARGLPAVALVSLLASDIIDLTFVFGAIALIVGTISIKAPILKREGAYLLILALPLFLGIDGTISRWDGAVLLLAGIIFLSTIAADHKLFSAHVKREDTPRAIRTGVLLIVTLLVLTVAADFTVSFLSLIGAAVGVPPAFIAIFVIGLGTCLPETLFTIRALQHGKHDLALGNILGVVIIDASVMLGIAALINPITVNLDLIRTVTLFNALAGCAAIYFIRIHRRIGRWEAGMLLAFYGMFAALQFVIH